MNFRLGGDEEAYNSERPMRADKILRTRGGLVQPKSQGKDSLTGQKLLFHIFSHGEIEVQWGYLN